MKSRVFVVHQPTKLNADGKVINSMDLRPAAEFGEVIFLLDDTANPFTEGREITKELWDGFSKRSFGRGDFLLLVGNPALIAVTAIMAHKYILHTNPYAWPHRLRLLQWQREGQVYQPVEFQL